jgi:protein-L-isoaspartate(D-aspartate) O-methyltransferase
MSTIADSPETLRAVMVDNILATGHATTPAVEQAMRTVPRHEFVPAASHEDAYADIAVITKRASNGAPLSCASVPTVVAMMLDQLQVRPGDRVLEIGAGTGYNALLAHLTGPTGHVTTVDIDPEVTAGARQGLDATGHNQAEVITRDGSLGADENAPYDRIIFTVGAWDLTPALWEQLAPGGRLVAPLRWRGQTRSVAFVRDGDALRSDSVELCGFVPMIGQEGERSGHIDSDRLVALYWDVDQSIDAAALTGVLEQPKEAI